jgi:hypothetical protein
MNRVSLIIGLFLTGLLPLPATATDEHIIVPPDNLNWGAAPPAFPKGAQICREQTDISDIVLPSGRRIARGKKRLIPQS